MLRNILFDFGGVLLNLDEQLTYDKLNQILDLSKCENINEEVFHPFERGEISEEAFFNRLQRRSKKVLTGDVYYEAWNSMLLDLPSHRIEFLRKLKTRYNLYLLSNTNITHIRKVLRRIKMDHGIDNFNSYFNKAYYSHEIHLRKPDKETFEYVLSDSQLIPQETLFIDDKEDNLIHARKLGIHCYHHNPSDDISIILDQVISSFDAV